MNEPSTTCLQLGDPVLRCHALPVDNVAEKAIQATVTLMQTVLTASQGVGIAAPQINVSKQIIIVASRPNQRYPNAPLMAPTVMFNPTFEAVGTELEKDWEGCLSVPSIRALVPRFKTIQARYINVLGDLEQMQLEGFVARIFQHECDHLQGKVFLDRVDATVDIIAESEYLKLFN
ncbi:MAG: peptide deformylase [Methylovulum sp.]|jgi:peptide deformylase|nr:peptide deformylase [Methylovulum sp.]